MNFDTGTTLADFQQSLFDKLQENIPITPAELSRLEGNYWVKAAETLAPSNLVVRHYCLIDLIKKNLGHYKQIVAQINKLTYASKSNDRIWAEGYSYWLYTKSFIVQYYMKIIPHNDVRYYYLSEVVSSIDKNFLATAYLRGSIWYPAPFGDLRDIPLEPELQNNKEPSPSCSIGCVSKTSDVSYTIQGWSVGLNPHTPSHTYDIKIIDGIPLGFVFYNGYALKYPSIISEWADILNLKRIFSLFR